MTAPDAPAGSMSGPTEQPSIALHTPADLVAAVPHLLGFRPHDSIVLIGHRAERGLVGTVVRADLPPPHLVSEQAARLAEAVTGTDTEHAAITAVLVGHPPDNSVGHPREGSVDRAPAAVHRALREALARALAARGVPLAHAVWLPALVSGAEFTCLSEPDCGGTLPDIDASVLAATTASLGMVTFGSRAELERLLDPDDPAAVRRREAALRVPDPAPDATTDATAESTCDAAAERDANPAADLSADSEAALSRAVADVRAGLFAVRDGRPLTDDQFVRLARALGRHRVRDACLNSALRPRSPVALTAEELWLRLARGLPAPERAEPATLLAYSAYLRGDGPLAGVALEHARAADPGHLLAGLLDQALQHGLKPSVLHRLGRAENQPDLGLPPDGIWPS